MVSEGRGERKFPFGGIVTLYASYDTERKPEMKRRGKDDSEYYSPCAITGP